MAGLATAFVEAHPGRVETAPQVLEAELQRLWARAAEAWTGFEVSPEVYAAYVAARTPQVPAGADAWAAIEAADLLLACACAVGDARALTAFERRYAAAVEAKAAKMTREGVTADEVRQQVWHKLFVNGKIRDYTGRGPMMGWLGVIVARTAIDLGRSAGAAAARSLSDGLMEAQADPELEYLKRLYREAFDEALRGAIEALTPKQRNLLAYNLIEGLDTNQIGGIYGVHRTSVGRWLSQARDALLAHTRRSLMQRLQVSRDDVDSIMRLINSRLDVTFRHLLRREE